MGNLYLQMWNVKASRYLIDDAKVFEIFSEDIGSKNPVLDANQKEAEANAKGGKNAH
jgi:hypothetical protein